MPAAVEKKVTMTPGGLSKIMKTLKNTDNGGVQKKTSAVAETPSKKDKKKKDNKKDLPKPAPSSTVVIKAALLAQKKRKKDPSAPKGAKSAYICFCEKERANISRDNPNLAATEIMTELGKRWKALSDKEKKPYEKQAETDRARFNEAMKNYEPPETDDDEKQGKRRKKDPDAPKNAKSAYIIFCAAKRSTIPKETAPKDVMSKLGQMWSATSVADKKPYEDLSKKDKVRYEKEMAKYKEKQN
jgi:hypothetical protein